MARDYVKSSNRQRRRQQRSQASFSAWWLVTGALVLLFIAGLYYLKQNSIKLTHQNQDKTEKSSRHASTRDKQDKKAKEPAKTAAAQPVKPQFDFYTVLPESKVEVPKNLPANKPNSSPLTKPKPPAAPAPSTATDTKPAQSAPIPITNYVLQIAAVKDATEADRLKAELTLQGFSR
ncbi:MAG: hypothetical protein HWD59_04865 [Coxiellaceae bacterium]|nr:MAG: hypothetical protein HWD59_04865 [Coxiellaceae bacterium]